MFCSCGLVCLFCRGFFKHFLDLSLSLISWFLSLLNLPPFCHSPFSLTLSYGSDNCLFRHNQLFFFLSYLFYRTHLNVEAFYSQSSQVCLPPEALELRERPILIWRIISKYYIDCHHLSNEKIYTSNKGSQIFTSFLILKL